MTPAAAQAGDDTLFEQALEFTLPAARQAFLQQACGNDVLRRERLEKLLTAQARAEAFFSSCTEVLQNPNGLTAVAAEKMAGMDEQIGSQIGPYLLRQRIGEGGCGVVYLAEQEQPVRRRVALKVIKLGMDTKNVIARFEAERLALALMDHPNIARVLDAGATAAGRPYFVMELVPGVKLTEYCDQNNLDTRQRLDLFIQICHAIQHAHQKGVIHRDIKPSNILVTLHDGVPVPKVIDFGIAKAIEGKLTEQTHLTASEQLIGTPAYMSPEQAQMSGLDVDTRSDIYSLGVLLYELLTGVTPFDGKELVKSGLDAMRRTLLETEPPRPSAKLHTLPGMELTVTARHRHAEPPRLLSQLKGDLDWIVMKALEKDRRRRYETANGLALDLHRYLNHEPVLARSPGRWYRFQKLVRRNLGVFVAGTAVAVSLVIGLSVSTWLFLMEKAARQRAVQAEYVQLELRQRAEGRERLSQAALFASQNRFEVADQLMAHMNISQPTLEGAAVFRSLGEWQALRGNWPAAAQRYAALQEVNQLDGGDQTSLDALAESVVLAEAGETNDFNRFRQKLMARFAAVTNATLAARVIKAALLLPADRQTVAALRPLAEAALLETEAGTGFPIVPPGSWPEPDSTPDFHHPALITAASFDGRSIVLNFNLPMESASLASRENYQVSGTTVTAAAPAGDGQSVVLSLAPPLTGRFSVTVTNLKDAAHNPATIGNTATSAVLGWQLRDIHTGQPFSASYEGNQATITAGGADIWDRTDAFVYVYTRVAGDFDYRMRVHSVAPALDKFTRVGLMARDSLTDPGSSHVLVAVNAENTFQALLRTSADGGTASLPPNPLPTAYGSNSWVRLQRAGAVFHAYSSSNGVDWSPVLRMYQSDLGNGNNTFSDPIYLGIAACSHRTNQTTTAVVSDVGLTPSVPINAAMALALLEYRRGDYPKAIEWCQQCLGCTEYNAARTALARVIQALACQQLQQKDKARTELALGRDLINSRFADGLSVGSTSQGFWFDWVFARILLAEADASIH